MSVDDVETIKDLVGEIACLARRFVARTSKYGTEEEIDQKIETIHRLLDAKNKGE